MRKLTSVLATCVALVVSLATAHAAQLYVPLTNYPGDGTTLEIVVTNPDTIARTFSGAIIAEGSNGNVDTGTPTDAVTIDPGATRVIKAPPGTGTLAAQRLRRARDQRAHASPDPDRRLSGRGGPVSSTATTCIRRTRRRIVQSMLAAHGYLSDFALWNASKATARCEASVHLVNGTPDRPGLPDPRRSALAHAVRQRGRGRRWSRTRSRRSAST